MSGRIYIPGGLVVWTVIKKLKLGKADTKGGLHQCNNAYLITFLKHELLV
jgi:hypothetical protein